MKKLAYDISPHDALGVMKTFSIALNLVNAAEVHHRMRLVRKNEHADDTHHIGPLPMIEDSIRGTMEILLEDDGVSPDSIFAELMSQKCEIVLTAHPTEVNRKTIIRKCELNNFDQAMFHFFLIIPSLIKNNFLNGFQTKTSDRNISELLAHLERPDLHPFERAEALNNLRGIIAAIWGSDEIR